MYMKLIQVCLVVVPVSLLLQGCGVHRKLKITEVEPNRVEILLAEPSSNSLALTRMKLKWISNDPMAPEERRLTTGELNLALAGSLRGGQFLVIFEDPEYHDLPVAVNFHGSIAGIKVKDGFFSGYGRTPSVSMSVEGEHDRSYIKDKVSDVVRFGPRPRPNLSGTFNEDGSLDHVRPLGNRSISRAFSGHTPLDTDSESDWSLKDASSGVPTAP